jgi:hypothetical protein
MVLNLGLSLAVDFGCHTRILGVQNPGANIITRCARTKSHTYDEFMAQDRMSYLY